jgi:hypothetical protein
VNTARESAAVIVHWPTMLPTLLAVALLLTICSGEIIDFKAIGAVPEVNTLSVQQHNGALMNTTLNSLRPGDVFVVPNTTFHIMGGILVTESLKNVVFQLDGTLEYVIFQNSRLVVHLERLV